MNNKSEGRKLWVLFSHSRLYDNPDGIGLISIHATELKAKQALAEAYQQELWESEKGEVYARYYVDDLALI